MPKKILVIDDDLTIVKMLQSRLVKEGFDVAAALNGAKGLNELETMTPDLIILDIQMPGMDGYAFLLELRKRQDHPQWKPYLSKKAYCYINENKLTQKAYQRHLVEIPSCNSKFPQLPHG